MVSSDAVVQIAGSRYSLPVAYIGRTVTVRALLGVYGLVVDGQIITRYAVQGRGAVVMEPAHYAGLLLTGPRVAGAGASPSGFDPAYPASADIAVWDLEVYTVLVEGVNVLLLGPPSSV